MSGVLYLSCDDIDSFGVIPTGPHFLPSLGDFPSYLPLRKPGTDEIRLLLPNHPLAAVQDPEIDGLTPRTRLEASNTSWSAAVSYSVFRVRPEDSFLVPIAKSAADASLSFARLTGERLSTPRKRWHRWQLGLGFLFLDGAIKIFCLEPVRRVLAAHLGV